MDAQAQHDKLLFTPGPLTVSESVLDAGTRNLGSRDPQFIDVIADIRRRLLQVAGQADDSRYTAVLMQGAGTFAIESVISSTLAPEDKLLILINGAYGRRMAEMASIHQINTLTLITPEDQTPDLVELENRLREDPSISMVAVVHCETTTGILNPLSDIAAIVRRHNRRLFVDAMSSFGAIPVDIAALGITYLVSSANKCIEGVPGFSFVLAEIDALTATKGHARTLSLDLYAQWQGLEKNGQFRFTPPVQSMLSFRQALIELDAEGGVEGRGARYRLNHETLTAGMLNLGFRPYLAPEVQSIIITSYRYPDHANFDFERFYNLLSERGFAIYPGKLSQADCFRLGNIGRLYPEHMQALLGAISAVMDEMEIR